MIFIQSDALLYLINHELSLILEVGSDSKKPDVSSSSKPPTGDHYETLNQDGIEIFISKKLKPEELFRENQINITMKKGLIKRSWSAEIVPKQKSTGFMGMRC